MTHTAPVAHAPAVAAAPMTMTHATAAPMTMMHATAALMKMTHATAAPMKMTHATAYAAAAAAHAPGMEPGHGRAYPTALQPGHRD